MDFAAARQTMVASQILTNRVSDARVVDAIAQVPREMFVPKPLRCQAYADGNLALGGGRALMAPLTLARLIQAAAITPGDVVLNMGDATGYTTAVLARLAQTVVSLECDPDWSVRSTAALTEFGIDNAAVVQGNLGEGFAAQAPYDVILVSGAIAEIPASLCQQLVNGGRLVAVVNGAKGMGTGTLVVRAGDSFSRRPMFDAALPLLPGFERKAAFAL